MGRVQESIEVNAPVAQCYDVWNHFELFPQFMKNVESVTRHGETDTWHWCVKGPMGSKVEWDARVVDRVPNQVISWNSLQQEQMENVGRVTFEPSSANQTLVTVDMLYNPPAGALGEAVADIFKNPDQMVKEDLRSFKQLVEGQKVGVTHREGLGYGPSAEAGAPDITGEEPIREPNGPGGPII